MYPASATTWLQRQLHMVGLSRWDVKLVKICSESGTLQECSQELGYVLYDTIATSKLDVYNN
jgi:hypothetical protein